MAAKRESTPKPLLWIGSTKDDIGMFPGAARREVGYALYLVQIGMKAVNAEPLKGFGGAGVLEVIARHGGQTYRAAYTVKFAEAVFVLHAFVKRSKKGIATPRADIELIKRRLRTAAEQYQLLYGGKES